MTQGSPIFGKSCIYKVKIAHFSRGPFFPPRLQQILLPALPTKKKVDRIHSSHEMLGHQVDT